MPSLPASCPRCTQDLANYASLPDALVTCPSCQFPLLLIAGKYRLTSLLAQGGAGSLYAAKHVSLEKDADRVVKLIPPTILEYQGMRKRFWREVQVTSVLSQRNPHIVRVFDDFGEIPTLGGFYVMEYLQGRSLREMLMDYPLLPREWAFEIMRQLCDAMHDAHEEGIVHRDLKPDNLFLISYRRQDLFLKVLDFGIAKPFLEGGDLARLTQGILGTPAYIAPEQVNQRPIDPRTDLYSMALIFYEMLTGQIPFFTPEEVRSLSPLGILSIRLTTPEIPPPHLVRPDLGIPEALSSVICKALSILAEDRPPSVAAFWAEIQEAAGLPLDAPQTPSFPPSYNSSPALALSLASPSTPASSQPLNTAEWAAPSHRSSPPATIETHPPLPVATFVMHPPLPPSTEFLLRSASSEAPAHADEAEILPAQKRRGFLLLGAFGCFLLLTLSLLLLPLKRPISPSASKERPRDGGVSLAMNTKAGAESAPHEAREPVQAIPSKRSAPGQSESADAGQAGAEQPSPKPLQRPASPEPRKPKVRTPSSRRRLRGKKKNVEPPRRPPPVSVRRPLPPAGGSPCGEGFVFLRARPSVSLKDLLVSETHRAASRAVQGGLCLPKGIGDVGVERDGYELCRFQIGHERSSLSLWLKEKDTPSAFESCLRP